MTSTEADMDPMMKGDAPAAKLKSERQEKGTVLSLSGRVSLDDLNGLMRETDAFFAQPRPARLTMDLSALEYVDSAGALFLLDVERQAQERSIPFEFINMSPQVQSVVGLLDRDAIDQPPHLKEEQSPSGFFEGVGMGSMTFLDDIGRSITFGGTLIWEVVLSILRPSSLRWKDVVVYMRKVGVDGLPILALISYLLGLIMAFMSSLQLKQFGANMYVPSLVAIAMVRELGPIITAIVVAGRSGSAFAAEIGTMKVNEEVDALVTMGFDPVRFLAVPKVFAAILVVPLLTFFSDLFAILGGMTVGMLGLSLTFYTYVQQTAWALEVFDIGAGVVKSIVFAVLIAGIGCLRGFQTRGGAEAVGNATTSAVVSSLFLIIVADSTFAIILNYVR
jgi:phospholipid/cholesterol/gamma-HCH transport system permease protein